MKSLLLVLTLITAATPLFAVITPIPDKIPCAVLDRQDFTTPDLWHPSGWIGMRVSGNEANRLVKIDPARLLEGYRKRPGRQSWDGEHVGKWLHAATLAWANTGDPNLRQKLDYMVTELLKCQLEDGYLGTYLDKDRWTEWDVWAHKYNLIGLITYMRYTGNLEPLSACRRMADLLCRTFGDEPGKRDIIKAGHHVGMAPTSVLEPMVLLYRMTAETRYLDFCEYLLRSWEQPNGPKIISTLLSAKRVDKVGNAKAYEMLSCLNGALEYYRTTGRNPQILEACLHAWQDIVDKRLYLTGASSYREHFHDDFDLPNVDNVGETCVTVTWLQFNAQLLRLRNEARFADQLERVILNQLFGAQRPDCAAWGYYVQMEGKKPYSETLDGHCCLSSGPRGVSLIPTFAVSTDADGVVVNLYEAGKANLTLRDKSPVSFTVSTLCPSDDKVLFTIDSAPAKAFAFKLRLPSWCPNPAILLNGTAAPSTPATDGYAVLQRQWTQGDRIEMRLPLVPRMIVGDHKNEGRVAFLYGPLVLAADDALLASSGLGVSTIAIPATAGTPSITPESAPGPLKTWPGARVFRTKAIARKTTPSVKAGSELDIRLLPFADAGGTGTRYKLWLPLPRSGPANLLVEGGESRSRPGNLSGSINDEDPQSFVVTFDGKPASQDWFAVSLDAPVEFKRVVLTHGSNFHDGGWFDASGGKPRVEIQREKGAAWEKIGEFSDYPPTTSANHAGIKPGQTFTVRLPEPVRAIAVRVIGTPASGDNPNQAFSSCAELQALTD